MLSHLQRPNIPNMKLAMCIVVNSKDGTPSARTNRCEHGAVAADVLQSRKILQRYDVDLVSHTQIDHRSPFKDVGCGGRHRGRHDICGNNNNGVKSIFSTIDAISDTELDHPYPLLPQQQNVVAALGGFQKVVPIYYGSRWRVQNLSLTIDESVQSAYPPLCNFVYRTPMRLNSHSQPLNKNHWMTRIRPPIAIGR